MEKKVEEWRSSGRRTLKKGGKVRRGNMKGDETGEEMTGEGKEKGETRGVEIPPSLTASCTPAAASPCVGFSSS